MTSETPPAGAAKRPAAVLDTNAVLDWLVFRDPGMAALAAAIEAGEVTWLACASMRIELERTLADAALARWSPDAAAVLGHFDRHAAMRPPPALAPGLVCSDRDDQVFIDLAVAAGARWLLTHDKALLRLARQALAAGVRVLKPGAWADDAAAG